MPRRKRKTLREAASRNHPCRRYSRRPPPSDFLRGNRARTGNRGRTAGSVDGTNARRASNRAADFSSICRYRCRYRFESDRNLRDPFDNKNFDRSKRDAVRIFRASRPNSVRQRNRCYEIFRGYRSSRCDIVPLTHR